MNISPESLVEKLLAAGFEIETWIVLGVGQNSIAILANDEWVFRVPLHSSAADSLAAEVEVLRAVQGRLPVLTPDPEIVVEVPGVEWHVMAYRAIAGQPLEREQIDSLDTVSLNRLGRDLGRFMNTLHGTPASQFNRSVVRDYDNQEQWERLRNDTRQYLKPRVVSSIWNRLNRKLGKSIEKISRFEFEPVLRHGDFGFGNFLFDRQSHLTGVIDFGSAGFGDPAVDVAGLIASIGPGELLIDKVRPTYPDVDGMLDRARIYRETFALQHALLGAKGDDEIAIKEGLDSYLGE